MEERETAGLLRGGGRLGYDRKEVAWDGGERGVIDTQTETSLSQTE